MRMVAKIIHTAPRGCLNAEKTGKAPNIKAVEARPKANAGRPGKTFEIATSVIGMVTLNKNIPNIATAGTVAPNANSGIDATSEPMPMRIQPNRSAMTPPRPLPKTIAAVSTKSKAISDFHGKTIIAPTNDLTAIEVRMRSNAAPMRCTRLVAMRLRS